MNRLTPWIIVSEFCAMRCLVDADISVVANRVAFIEKTPRVRVHPFTVDPHDCHNWECGPKGAGGSDGHIPENELYGFYPPSRKWCDDRLKELGYILG